MSVTMYSRPSPSDYDDWETVYSNKGWGSRDLIPLLKKVSNISILASDQSTQGLSDGDVPDRS